jgi:hypothetical protein
LGGRRAKPAVNARAKGNGGEFSNSDTARAGHRFRFRSLPTLRQSAASKDQAFNIATSWPDRLGLHHGMPHLRSQPASLAGLSPLESMGWSRRLTPRFSAWPSSIPHCSRFGVGCPALFGTTDENNDSAITAASMAGHDVAAGGPRRVRARDRFCVRNRGDSLSGRDRAALCRDTRNRRPLPGDGRDVAASGFIGKAQLTVRRSCSARITPPEAAILEQRIAIMGKSGAWVEPGPRAAGPWTLPS